MAHFSAATAASTPWRFLRCRLLLIEIRLRIHFVVDDKAVVVVLVGITFDRLRTRSSHRASVRWAVFVDMVGRCLCGDGLAGINPVCVHVYCCRQVCGAESQLRVSAARSTSEAGSQLIPDWKLCPHTLHVALPTPAFLSNLTETALSWLQNRQVNAVGSGSFRFFVGAGLLAFLRLPCAGPCQLDESQCMPRQRLDVPCRRKFMNRLQDADVSLEVSSHRPLCAGGTRFGDGYWAAGRRAKPNI